MIEELAQQYEQQAQEELQRSKAAELNYHRLSGAAIALRDYASRQQDSDDVGDAGSSE